MTVASETSKSGPYTGNGVTTVFDYEFRIIDEAHIRVLRTEANADTILSLGADYTVSGVGGTGGGSITMTTAPIASQQVTILRNVPFTQETDLENQGAFFAETIEASLDLSAMRDQQLSELLSRAVIMPASQSAADIPGFVADVENAAANAATAIGARDAALAAASSLGNQVHQYDTRALAIAATIPVGVQAIKVTRFATGSRLSYATYVPGTLAGPMAFQEAGGHWWELDVSGGIVNVLWFGAKGDGATDDTVAIQSAINAVQGTGATVFFPRGAYKISSPIIVTGTIRLVGESRYGTTITWTSTTIFVLNINTAQQVFVERITFTGPAAATAGNIITLDGPGPVGNLFSYVRDCQFIQGYNHIVTLSAADWTIENCTFSEYVAYGTYVSDTLNNDAGDSYIGGCTYSTSAANAVAIEQVSSGGLKVESNKILGGAYGYRLDLTSTGPNTVDLLMNGNSIENQITAAIVLNRPSGTVQFGSVVIDGNQIGGAGSAVSTSWVGIATDANAGWLSRLIISDNLILLPIGAGSPNFYGISLGSPSSFIVSGNEIIACPNAGGQNIGISIGAGATAGLIGVNKFDVFGGGTWTNKIGNGAPASVLVQQSVPQSGNAGVTCSTAYGPLYIGTIAVNFGVAYDIPPTVKCYPNSLVSGVSAWPVNITKTGFTLNAISATNGGAGTVTWEALGVL